MKRISTFLMILLALVMLAVPVLAAQTATMTVAASVDSLDKGDTVVITVSASKVESCEVGGFMFSFDKNVFEYVSGECMLTGYGMSGVSLQGGNISGYFASGSKTVEGDLFKITLRVKETAAYGTYTITGTPNMKAGGAVVECSVSEVTVAVACRHQYDKFQFVNDNEHRHTCVKCSEPETLPHEWNEGTITLDPTCEQEGEVQYKCVGCAATTTAAVDPTGHAWDNDCDADCNNGCGVTRVTEHSYQTEYSSDETGHWLGCIICQDKMDFAEHTPGPEATLEEAQLCLECGFEIAPKLTHEHQMSTSWISDDVYHWHRCQWSSPSCYYVEDKAEHDYDNDCDVDCNTCGFIRLDAPHNYNQEWQGDAEGHWYFCVDCFAQSEAKPHIPGPEATETEPQRCKECNIVIKMPLSHVHEFETWYYDEDSHWQYCNDIICFETTDPEPHTWDEGLDMATGGKQYTCVHCGKQRVTEGPAPTVPSTAPTTQPTTAPAKTEEPQEQSGIGFSWEWIAIAAIVLLAIGFILLIIEFIRSRKRNSHGRFSK